MTTVLELTVCRSNTAPLPSTYIVLSAVLTGDLSCGKAGEYSIKSFISKVKCADMPESRSHKDPILLKSCFPLHLEQFVLHSLCRELLPALICTLCDTSEHLLDISSPFRGWGDAKRFFSE